MLGEALHNIFATDLIAPNHADKSRIHHIRICRIRLSHKWLNRVRQTREHYLLRT